MWSMDVLHSDLPRGRWEPVIRTAPMEQILAGALRAAMATTGYATLKEFQKAEIMLASPPVG
jgi:IMP dehydrogenase